LSGVPMVVAYRVSKPEEILKYLIKAPSIVLTNLVLGENIIPELIQWDCTPEKLAAAMIPLLSDTPERRRQMDAFARLDSLMRIEGEIPSERAARIVSEVLARSSTQPLGGSRPQ
jgi:lipid-A-disaccharide synthase